MTDPLSPPAAPQPRPAAPATPRKLSKKWLFGVIGGGALAIVVLACIAVLASQSDSRNEQAAPPTSPVVPAASSTTPQQPPQPTPAPSDPYQQYLALNPDSDLVLSREDAQARAFLGCGIAWAPGTIDAALAEAYRPTGICGVTPPVVHPGSFCALAGAAGVTSTGTPMVCRTTASDSSLRWRQPE